MSAKIIPFPGGWHYRRDNLAVNYIDPSPPDPYDTGEEEDGDGLRAIRRGIFISLAMWAMAAVILLKVLPHGTAPSPPKLAAGAHAASCAEK
jgi:uncharacterized membrane protein YbhN (UPF0104 family)